MKDLLAIMVNMDIIGLFHKIEPKGYKGEKLCSCKFCGEFWPIEI